MLFFHSCRVFFFFCSGTGRIILNWLQWLIINTDTIIRNRKFLQGVHLSHVRFRVEQVPKGLHFLKMFQTGRIEPPVKLSHTHTYTHVYIQYNIPTPSIYRLYISLNTKKVTHSSEMRSTSTQRYIYIYIWKFSLCSRQWKKVRRVCA